MEHPPLVTVPPGTVLHRIHRNDKGPIFFGPPGDKPEQRFDSPDASYKVLYLALALETSFGEVFVRKPANRYVFASEVRRRARSEPGLTRPLNLYPLDSAVLSALGVTLADVTGDAYAKTWALSARIHAETQADGIRYPSRFNTGPCIALFDRASAAVRTGNTLGVPIMPEEAEDLAMRFGKLYVEA